MTTWAWYWQVVIALVWVAVVLALVVWALSAPKGRAWIPAVLLGLTFLVAPGALIAYSWLDDDAPYSRCGDAGGIVVVTPAQGRVCIDKSVVIPEREWTR